VLQLPYPPGSPLVWQFQHVINHYLGTFICDFGPQWVTKATQAVSAFINEISLIIQSAPTKQKAIVTFESKDNSCGCKVRDFRKFSLVPIKTPSLEPSGFVSKLAWKQLRSFPLHASVHNFAWKNLLQKTKVRLVGGVVPPCRWCSFKGFTVLETPHHVLFDCITTQIALKWMQSNGLFQYTPPKSYWKMLLFSKSHYNSLEIMATILFWSIKTMFWWLRNSNYFDPDTPMHVGEGQQKLQLWLDKAWGTLQKYGPMPNISLTKHCSGLIRQSKGALRHWKEFQTIEGPIMMIFQDEPQDKIVLPDISIPRNTHQHKLNLLAKVDFSLPEGYIAVYTDGSWIKSANLAGMGAFLENHPERTFSKILKDHEPTINKAELEAVTQVLLCEPLDQPLKIFVDSNYFCANYENILNHWTPTQAFPTWMTIANKQYWHSFCLATLARKAPQIYVKIPSHVGIAGNDQADRLAKLAIQRVVDALNIPELQD